MTLWNLSSTCRGYTVFFVVKTSYLQNFNVKMTCWKFVGSWWDSISGSSWSQVDNITTWWYDTVSVCYGNEIWISYINNVLSNKTILFDILDFWCQFVVIRLVKTLSKRRMFVSSMKISACWLLHRLIKFNKICWEKRPAEPRPNLRTLFCRRDFKGYAENFFQAYMGGWLVGFFSKTKFFL